jgi:HAD superfamily hydrolase (TIGR01549 family)
MDGTLVYFQIDFLTARRSVISYLIENGVPEDLLDINLTIRENTSRAVIFLKEKSLCTEDTIQNILRGVNSKMIEVEIQAASKAKAVSGVEKVLSYCKQNGIKQVICTYNTHQGAELTLKNALIYDYIDDIYGRDDVVKSKPDIEHLKPAIEKYHITPEEALLIGDYETDIQLGKSFWLPNYWSLLRNIVLIQLIMQISKLSKKISRMEVIEIIEKHFV